MAGLPGYKGKIVIGSAATVAEMGTWAVSGMTLEMLEDTQFEDAAKSYVPGRIDGGTLTFSGHYDPDDSPGQEALMTNFTAKTAVTDPLFYYSNAGWFKLSSGAEAFVESLDIGVDQSGIGTISFTLRISGGYLEKN